MSPASHGRQVTYEHDLTDPQQMRREVHRLARQLADEMSGAEVRRVVVTVRFHPFETRSHGSRVEPPAGDAAAIEAAADAALDAFELDRSVRLLGVRAELASDLPTAL